MAVSRKKVLADFFVSENGRQPVREWLLNLSRNDRRIIGKDIQKVEFGWPIGMPYCRNIERGIWEVRSSLGGNRIARVLFCLRNDRMVLLHSFIKKTRATPQNDKALARRRMMEI